MYATRMFARFGSGTCRAVSSDKATIKSPIVLSTISPRSIASSFVFAQSLSTSSVGLRYRQSLTLSYKSVIFDGRTNGTNADTNLLGAPVRLDRSSTFPATHDVSSEFL